MIRSHDLFSAAEQLATMARGIEDVDMNVTGAARAAGTSIAEARSNWAGPATDVLHTAVDGYLATLPVLGGDVRAAAESVNEWSQRAMHLADELALAEAAITPTRLDLITVGDDDSIAVSTLAWAQHRVAEIAEHWATECQWFAAKLDATASSLRRFAATTIQPLPSTSGIRHDASGPAVGWTTDGHDGWFGKIFGRWNRTPTTGCSTRSRSRSTAIARTGVCRR